MSLPKDLFDSVSRSRLFRNALPKYHSKAGESESKLWKFFVSLPAQSASGHHLGENEFWLNEDNYARNFLLASLWTINMSDEGEWGGSEKYGYKGPGESYPFC